MSDRLANLRQAAVEAELAEAVRRVIEVAQDEIIVCTRQRGQCLFVGFAPQFETAFDALAAALAAYDAARAEAGGTT